MAVLIMLICLIIVIMVANHYSTRQVDLLTRQHAYIEELESFTRRQTLRIDELERRLQRKAPAGFHTEDSSATFEIVNKNMVYVNEIHLN